MRFIKEPLIQFLVIGACIYGAYALFGTPEDDTADRIVIVDQARIEGFTAQWQQRWNRPPTRKEIDGIINSYVRENILYQQAVAMGLGEDDPITRRRVAQKLEFLTSDLALMKEPAAGELEQYFQDNQDVYREDDLITFSHVFLDPDLRDETTLDDAAALLAQLQAAGAPDAATLEAGDRFMLQNYYPAASELEIRRQLGSGFAESVLALEPGRWHGPVLSGYGVHLVYVYEFQKAPAPLFADVEESVLQNWQAVQQEKFNAEFYESLKKLYDIEIAAVPAELILNSDADAPGEDQTATGTEPAS
jgi:hypothetical protein